MDERQIDPRLKIVFFDGVCHLCNGFVDFLIQNETAQTKLSYAPLQGTTAQQYLPETDQKNLATVIFLSDGKLFKKSEAVLRILREMKLPFSLFGSLGFLVPRFLRDLIYDFVARHRYQWFGERESCRLPQPHEKGQLLP